MTLHYMLFELLLHFSVFFSFDIYFLFLSIHFSLHFGCR